MKHKLIALISIAVLTLVLAPMSGAHSQRRHVETREDRDDRDMPEREDINQTYELNPGARVELSVIAGSVDVETTNGNTAEVHITRLGQTRTDLDCNKIAIENTPDSVGPRQGVHPSPKTAPSTGAPQSPPRGTLCERQ